MKKFYQVLSKTSRSRGKGKRQIIRQDIIVNKPTSGTYADYLLLKKQYRKLDKHRNWRYKVAFNISFLREQKRTYGDLVCAFCGQKDLQIDTPHAHVPKNVMATVDHFDPTSKDGDEFNHDNMIPSCSKCNGKKGNEIYDIETLIYLPKEKLEKLKIYLENK